MKEDHNSWSRELGLRTAKVLDQATQFEAMSKAAVRAALFSGLLMSRDQITPPSPLPEYRRDESQKGDPTLPLILLDLALVVGTIKGLKFLIEIVPDPKRRLRTE